MNNLPGQLLQNLVLARYTSWKIGGPAEYFYEPIDLEDLKTFLHNYKKEPITIIGAATNVLIRDKGIKGLVIYLRNRLNKLDETKKNTLRVEAGVSLAALTQKCLNLAMEDAVFMAGIPGTVGGALHMNAGAYGNCIWNHVVAVESINRHGEIKTRPAGEFKAAYRQVSGLERNEWFVAAHLHFKQGSLQKMKQQAEEYLQRRKKSQPLDYPSCGSVFRNPPGNYAARLIEECGLKGRQIGGAKVSDKHANFIVNLGNACSLDIEMLMQEIIFSVKKIHKVDLVPEVQVLGEA